MNHKYQYPYIECNFHEGPQLSYLFCRHLLKDFNLVDTPELATETEVGTLLCTSCKESVSNANPDKDSIIVACEKCIHPSLWSWVGSFYSR